ncbi:MAG: methionine--tRNA ligase [Candidatus Humimicrobiaceae bacterium]
MGKEKFYLTTAIPYMNSKLHLGQIYEFIIADVVARFNRLKGNDVYFLTGSDEHGQKIYKTAREKGIETREYVDKMVADMKRLLKLYNITNDGFIRTTDEKHERTVQSILARLRDNGDLYKSHYEGNYCVPCETFLLDSQLVEGKCPECHRETERIKEENYFFKLSKYQDRLIEHLEKNPGFVFPETRRNEVLGLLKQGLKDISISRTTVTWGVPVPFDSKHYCYVWVDALINYISALGYSQDDSLFKQYWPANQHHIGKDILKFHAVIWPALLMSLGVELPEQIAVHGWVLLGKEKLSKSKGITLDPDDLAGEYGVDAIRYFVTREISFGNDGTFTYESLVKRYNGDLSNDIGNLVSRTMAMIKKFRDGIVPERSSNNDSFAKRWEALKSGAIIDLEDFKFSEYLSKIWEFINMANKYIEDSEPWNLAKSSKSPDAEKLDAILYELVESIRLSSVMVYPIMPGISQKILSQFGIGGNGKDFLLDEHGKWGYYSGGTKIREKEILFPRIKEK